MYLTDITSIKIDCSKEEIVDVAFDIRRAMLQSAETHWFNRYKSNCKSDEYLNYLDFVTLVKQEERKRIEKLDFLFGLVGMNYVTKSLDNDITEVFKKKIKK